MYDDHHHLLGLIAPTLRPSPCPESLTRAIARDEREKSRCNDETRRVCTSPPLFVPGCGRMTSSHNNELIALTKSPASVAHFRRKHNLPFSTTRG